MTSSGLRGQLIRAGSGVGLLKILSLLFGFLTSILLARSLGPGSYGQYALVTSVVTLLAIPLYAGLPALLVREIARVQVDGDWGLLIGLKRRTLQWISIGTAVIVTGVFTRWFLSDSNGNQGLSTYLLFALPLVPLMALNTTRAAILRGLKKVVQSQVPESVIQPLAHLLMILMFLYLVGMSVESALVSLALSTFLGFLVGQYLLSRETDHKVSGYEPKYKTRQWLLSLAPLTCIAAVQLINGQVSTLMLGLLSTNEEIGFLRVADRASQMVTLSLSIVTMTSAPYMAQFAKSGNKRGLQKIATESVRAALLMALPITIVLIVFGRFIVGFAFGEEYMEPVWAPLAILCLAKLVNVYYGSVGALLNMSGHENDTLLGAGIGLAVNCIIVWSLASDYGAMGAAIGTSSGLLVWNVFMAFRVRQRLGVKSTPF